MNRQREKALAWISLLGADDSHQYADVIVNSDQYSAGSLTGDTACLEGYGRLTELEFFDNRVHGVLPSLCGSWGTGFLRNAWAMSGIGPTQDAYENGQQGSFRKDPASPDKLEAGSLPQACRNPTDTQQTTSL